MFHYMTYRDPTTSLYTDQVIDWNRPESGPWNKLLIRIVAENLSSCLKRVEIVSKET